MVYENITLKPQFKECQMVSLLVANELISMWKQLWHILRHYNCKMLQSGWQVSGPKPKAGTF